MSRTLQFKRYDSPTIANTIGANGELIINTTNKTLTVHDGIVPGGFALLNSSTDLNEDNYARNTANTALTNTITIQGIDATQNNRLDSIEFINGGQNNFIILALELSQNAYDVSNTKFSSSGGQITGNVVIVGTLDVTGNTVIAEHLESNTIIVETTLYSGLASRSATPLPNLIAQFTSNSSSYIQVNAQNINPLGSGDYVVTADNGSDTDYYIDMGLQGSQLNQGTISAYDGYLLVQGSTIGQPGGNLVIGTTSSFPGLETKFISGGTQEENVVMRLSETGLNMNVNLVFSDSSIQNSASISIVDLKSLVANAATYSDFQIAIAAL